MLSSSEEFLERPLAGSHLVQFYDRDQEAATENVARYASAGLHAGEAVIFIGTPENAWSLRLALQRAGHSLDQRIRSQQLTILDGSATLARFMVEGQPDAERFDRVVGTIVRDTRRRFPAGVRAIGEMVGILWQRREFPAAVRLEQLWHRLLETVDFRLFCAYCVDPSDAEVDGEIVGAIVAAHTHLLPAGTSAYAQAILERTSTNACVRLETRSLNGSIPPN